MSQDIDVHSDKRSTSPQLDRSLTEGPDILTVGESMTSIRVPGPLKLGGTAEVTIAGAESNVATGLGRLGHCVKWAGALGDDESAQLILRTLRAEGVDTSAARTVAGSRTGLLLFERRMPDLTRVEYHRAGSAAAGWNLPAAEELLDPAPQILHLTGITPAIGQAARDGVEELAAAAQKAGVPMSFDVNYRSSLWSRDQASEVLTPLARAAEIVIASADELHLIADSIDELLAAGVEQVVLTHGGGGAEVVTSQGRVTAAARTVPVVDPIGAGDAFSAGYLSAVLDGASLQQRLYRGCLMGSFAVATEGDWEGLPTRGELSLLDVDEGEALR